MNKKTKLAAGVFKAQCLKLIDEISKKRVPLIITKHGKPLVKVIPYSEDKPKKLFGCLKNTIRINGDIVDSTGEEWDADQ